MYRLTAFRLVNWLHFSDVTRPLSGTTLLAGENGDGKSTILDAMQLALVADLRTIDFNGANGQQKKKGRRRRTLKGYVLWAEKVDDLGDDDAPPPPPRYRRDHSTSYVLLQFEDVVPDASGTPRGVRGPNGNGGASNASAIPQPPARALRAPFVCGVGIEAAAKGGEPTRVHVIVPDASLADLPLIDPTTRFATSLRDLEALVKRRRGGVATSSADAYMDQLRVQLGRLPRSLFPSLLTKGLAFKPVQNVRDFVVEFLLEPRPVETERLVDNLVHYEEMRRESERAVVRLKDLDDLVRRGDDVLQKDAAESIAEFVYLRADAEDATQAYDHHVSVADGHDQDELDESAKRDVAASRRDETQTEHDRLLRILGRDEKRSQKADLEEAKVRTAARLKHLDQAEALIRQHIGAQRALLDLVVAPQAPVAVLHSETFRCTLDEDSAVGLELLAPAVTRLRAVLDPGGTVIGRPMDLWDMELKRIGDTIVALRRGYRERLDELKRDGAEAQAAQARLMAGRGVQYRPELEALRFGLAEAERRGEITLRRPVVPFCELIDDVDLEWQDTVESWLGPRRFDLIPDPADFRTVNGWYEQHRNACPTSDGRTMVLYGVAVVNMERVMARQDRGRAPRPLSDVVHTTNPLATAYLEYLLGRVERCDSATEFGRHDNAATREGFLYRGFRSERVRPTQAVLGHAGREAQRKALDTRVGAIAVEMRRLQPFDQWLTIADQACDRCRRVWPLVGDRLTQLQERGALVAEYERLQQQIEAIDLSHLAGLENELATVSEVLKGYQLAFATADGNAKVAHALADKEREAAATAASLRDERQRDLDLRFPDASYGAQWAEHRNRFTERAQDANSMKELATNYRRRHAAARTEATTTHRGFDSARRAYEQTYEPILTAEEIPVATLRAEAERWRNTKLPEYSRQIDERIAAARVQLLDDVLAQLHSHFADLKKALDTLNRALQATQFGQDMYEFIWTPRKVQREFYDVITALGPSFDLAGVNGSVYEILEHDADMRRRLDDMLLALTANRHDPLAGLEEIRDYRTYFDYDIRVLDGQGKTYRLGRNDGVVSGGEIQTPTYVALLASIQQMYGASRSAAADCGLFLVDESFSHLDDRRIPDLMGFVRTLGLQGVLAMPSGREAHFAKYADTILMVSRDANGLGRIDDSHDLTSALLVRGESTNDGANGSSTNGARTVTPPLLPDGGRPTLSVVRQN